jgi:hypothetical protein
MLVRQDSSLNPESRRLPICCSCVCLPFNARRERRPEEGVRRPRLLRGRGAWSGCPGSITGARVIDISARHGEREVEVLMTRARATRRPPRTQLDGAGQLKRPPGDTGPVAERQPVTAPACAAVDTHQGVEAG